MARRTTCWLCALCVVSIGHIVLARSAGAQDTLRAGSARALNASALIVQNSGDYAQTEIEESEDSGVGSATARLALEAHTVSGSPGASDADVYNGIFTVKVDGLGEGKIKDSRVPGGWKRYRINYTSTYSGPVTFRLTPESSCEYEVSPMVNQKVRTCWATGAAMMLSWRDGAVSYTARDAAGRAGKEFVSAFDADKSLNDEQQGRFLEQLGMVAEGGDVLTGPVTSDTVLMLGNMLQRFGPLMVAVVTPDRTELNTLVVTGVEGDGTPESTLVFFNNAGPGPNATPNPLGDCLSAAELLELVQQVPPVFSHKLMHFKGKNPSQCERPITGRGSVRLVLQSTENRADNDLNYALLAGLAAWSWEQEKTFSVSVRDSGEAVVHLFLADDYPVLLQGFVTPGTDGPKKSKNR